MRLLSEGRKEKGEGRRAQGEGTGPALIVLYRLITQAIARLQSQLKAPVLCLYIDQTGTIFFLFLSVFSFHFYRQSNEQLLTINNTNSPRQINQNLIRYN